MIWAKIASGLMFLAVALGAFGAHALRGKLDERAMDHYRTAVLYHFIHALALFVAAWVSLNTFHLVRVGWAASCFLAGICLFSGSLYLMAITGIKRLGMITPVGGVLFLTGWVLLFLSIP